MLRYYVHSKKKTSLSWNILTYIQHFRGLNALAFNFNDTKRCKEPKFIIYITDFLEKPSDFTIAFTKSIYFVKSQFFIKITTAKKQQLNKGWRYLEISLQAPNDNQNGGFIPKFLILFE